MQSLAFRTCQVCKKYILFGHRLYAANSPKEIPRKPDTSVSLLLTIPYSRLSTRCEMQAVCPCSLLEIKAFTKTALTIVSSHSNSKIAQPGLQARKVTHCIKIALGNSEFTSSIMTSMQDAAVCPLITKGYLMYMLYPWFFTYFCCTWILSSSATISTVSLLSEGKARITRVFRPLFVSKFNKEKKKTGLCIQQINKEPE